LRRQTRPHLAADKKWRIIRIGGFNDP